MSKNESADAASMHPFVHTPGPWRTYDIFGGEYQEVFGPRTPGEDRLQVDGKADAKLIAAAPDLLEALQKFAAWHDMDHETMTGVEVQTAYDQAIDAAKSALRKVV